MQQSIPSSPPLIRRKRSITLSSASLTEVATKSLVSTTLNTLKSPTTPISSWNFEDIENWIRSLLLPNAIEKRLIGFVHERVLVPKTLFQLQKGDLLELGIHRVWVNVVMGYINALKIGRTESIPISILIQTSILTELLIQFDTKLTMSTQTESHMSAELHAIESMIQSSNQQVLKVIDNKFKIVQDDLAVVKEELQRNRNATSSVSGTGLGSFVDGMCIGGLVTFIWFKFIMKD
ncbi:hypothetical protein BKA69DRAFT_1122916 [Paraphysoderma sedebokerense]|nr:hypothetical protein BKA69DRAFT_1122916 [Paraphysoderma sedebokerense]